MEVTTLQSTDKPEKLVCMAARNDYEEDWVAQKGLRDTMKSIDPVDEMPKDVKETMDYKEDRLQRRMYNLITRLLEHGHYGPFEHPHITFAVKDISRSCMAQLTRHRHVSFDVQSMRYVDFEDGDVADIPETGNAEMHGRNSEMASYHSHKSDETIAEERRHVYDKAMEGAFEKYRVLTELGVAPENARFVLPIGAKVNVVFTLNARMLMHIADMRAAGDAQWEIREMTQEILQRAAEWCPITFHYYNEELKGRKNRLAP